MAAWCGQGEGENMETSTPLLPREKMLRDGATLLTDEELLALFLRTGTRSKNVFALARDLLHHLARCMVCCPQR